MTSDGFRPNVSDTSDDESSKLTTPGTVSSLAEYWLERTNGETQDDFSARRGIRWALGGAFGHPNHDSP